MTLTTLLPVAAVALLLGACASRPPEPTAETTAPRPAASTAQAPGPQSSGATSNAPSGRNVAGANATAPNDRSVYFAFDSDALTPKAQDVIRDNARYDGAQRAHVRLEGNADERGSREYNLALGQRRADAVRRAMELDGMPAGQMEAVSNGEERPRCTEHNEDCWAQNRRVDILGRQ